MMNKYGYKHQRGPGPGCQPAGLVKSSFEETEDYYGTVIYDRKLTEKEKFQYDLELIEEK